MLSVLLYELLKNLPVSNLNFPHIKCNFFFLVSNEVPEHPVVSPSSGAIFEKRIIEKYIIENGVDPISGKELAVEDLIEIKSNCIEY